MQRGQNLVLFAVIICLAAGGGCVKSVQNDTPAPTAGNPPPASGESPTRADAGDSDKGTDKVSGDVNGEAGGAQAASDEKIALTIADWAGIQQWIAGQKGKVVVVDVWSTYCGPCLQEFPHFVEVSQRYGEKIACASLSVDFYGGPDESAEPLRPQVLKVLVDKQAVMKNFLASESDESILARIKTSSIPAVLVYDRDGQLVKVFNNDRDEYGPEGFNYEKDIVPVIEKLLSAS